MSKYLEILTQSELDDGGSLSKGKREHLEDTARDLGHERSQKIFYVEDRTEYKPPAEWWVEREKNKKIEHIVKTWNRVLEDPKGFEFTQTPKGIQTSARFYAFAAPKPIINKGLNSRERRHAQRALEMTTGELQRMAIVDGSKVPVKGGLRADQGWSEQSPEIDIKERAGEQRKPFFPTPKVKPIYVAPKLTPAAEKKQAKAKEEQTRELTRQMKRKKGARAKELVLLNAAQTQAGEKSKAGGKTSKSAPKSVSKEKLPGMIIDNGEPKVQIVPPQGTR